MAKKRAVKLPQPRLNPAALSIEDLALLLTRAGGKSITAADIRSDLAAGAPKNADGSFHLIHYAAWLASMAD